MTSLSGAAKTGHALHCEGRTSDAYRYYRIALAGEPASGATLHLAGVAAHDLGDQVMAVALMSRAIVVDSVAVEKHFDHGVILRSAGRADAAARSFRLALCLLPHHAGSLVNLGETLAEMGCITESVILSRRSARAVGGGGGALLRLGANCASAGQFVEAELWFKTSIVLEPDSEEGFCRLGACWSALGLWEDGAAASQRAALAAPLYAEAHSNAAAMLLHVGRLGPAIEAARRAAVIQPDRAESYLNLGHALRQGGFFSESLGACRAAVSLMPHLLEPWQNLGLALRDSVDLGAAAAAFRTAVTLQPNNAEGLYNLGAVFEDLGEFDMATTSYARAIVADPFYPQPYQTLYSLKQCQAGDANLDQMERVIAGDQVPKPRNKFIYFALGKAYEDLEFFDRSFDMYAVGNALRKAELGYSIEQDRTLFEKIRSFFQFPIQPATEALYPTHLPRPIFILGMPRSGTSLVEQMLSCHPEVTPGGERETMNAVAGSSLGHSAPWPEIRDAVRNDYLTTLPRTGPLRRFMTDKMPTNFRWIGFIAEAIPEALIINLSREPMAVCWSIFKMNFASPGLGFAYDLDDIAEYYALYLDIMALWRERYSNRIYDLSYEALTERPETELRSLLDYCRLPWNSACLDFHSSKRGTRTASAGQVRRKLYTGSSEAWKRYEKKLKLFAESAKVEKLRSRLIAPLA